MVYGLWYGLWLVVYGCNPLAPPWQTRPAKHDLPNTTGQHTHPANRDLANNDVPTKDLPNKTCHTRPCHTIALPWGSNAARHAAAEGRASRAPPREGGAGSRPRPRPGDRGGGHIRYAPARDNRNAKCPNCFGVGHTRAATARRPRMRRARVHASSVGRTGT